MAKTRLAMSNFNRARSGSRWIAFESELLYRGVGDRGVLSLRNKVLESEDWVSRRVG
jgi:hypothetical protein